MIESHATHFHRNLGTGTSRGDRPAAVGHTDKGYLGQVALQNIVYFLQYAGVPVRYNFDIYYHGTYCERIPRDVELLVADGALKDISACPEKYPNYCPTDDADALLESHAAALRTHQEMIFKVLQTMLPLEPDHLKLLTTLHYAYRFIKAGGGSGPWKEIVIDRFLKTNGDKYERSVVSDAYDSMVRTNLLQA